MLCPGRNDDRQRANKSLVEAGGPVACRSHRAHETLRRFRVTAAKLAEADFSGLRSIMYGGAPMPTSVVRRMVDVFGCDLHNGFGAGTEAV